MIVWPAFVTTLVADDCRDVLCQEVGRLAFAFVAHCRPTITVAGI